jgi:hypothetical protein
VVDEIGIELVLRRDAEPAGHAGGAAEVPAVDVEAADGAGSAVEPLVAAPEREVDVPGVERVRRDPDGVREVEAGHDPPLVRGAGEPRHVEHLRAAVDGRGQHQHRDLVRHRRDDVVLLQEAAVAALHEHEVLGGVEAAQAHLALEREDVGGEVELVGQHLRAAAVRLIERGHQDVQVVRGGARRHHLVRRGADQRRLQRAEALGGGQPGPLPVLPSRDALAPSTRSPPGGPPPPHRARPGRARWPADTRGRGGRRSARGSGPADRGRPARARSRARDGTRRSCAVQP